MRRNRLLRAQQRLARPPRRVEPMFTSTANPFLALPLAGTKAADGVSWPETPGQVVSLTRGLAAGEEDAFRKFHALYFDRLYQFLLMVTHGAEDAAQEALQLTLLRLVRYARVFDSEETFWSWLKRLARSAACDAGRKQQRYGALLRDFALHRSDRVEDPGPAEPDRLHALLDESLEELALADRRLIEGKYLEGATVRELSHQEGSTEKAVESRLGRLRFDLRQRLLKKLRLP